jgi:hypothetical protein
MELHNNIEGNKSDIKTPEVETVRETASVDEREGLNMRREEPKKVENNAADIERLNQAREKIQQMGKDISGEQSVSDQVIHEHARGYMTEDGRTLTMEEFRKISDEFEESIKTRMMTKLGLWDDFKKRRALDKYFLNHGYRVSRRGKSSNG